MSGILVAVDLIPSQMNALTMSQRLNNYLRTYRRRSGLYQEDVALLLGCENGSKVSRYECSAREPSLENTLAYEAIFGIPIRELYAGMYQKVEEKTMRRAKELLQKLSAQKPEQCGARRLALIKALAGAHPPHHAIPKS